MIRNSLALLRKEKKRRWKEMLDRTASETADGRVHSAKSRSSRSIVFSLFRASAESVNGGHDDNNHVPAFLWME